MSPWTVRGEEPKVHRWRNAADEREKAGVAELAGFPVVPIGDDGTAGVPGAR